MVVGVEVSVEMNKVLLVCAHTVVPLGQAGHEVALALQDLLCSLSDLSWAFQPCLLSLVTVLVDRASRLENLRQLGEMLS